jgi:hypothetical protein
MGLAWGRFVHVVAGYVAKVACPVGEVAFELAESALGAPGSVGRSGTAEA